MDGAWQPLSSLKIDEPATVERIDVEGRTRRRLVEMGITPGTQVSISRRAPLGDPMELTVRNYELSVRKADAEMIEVV